MSKGKGKRRDISTAPSTSDRNSRPKPKVKTKSNPVKTVVEMLVSGMHSVLDMTFDALIYAHTDDDRTLVEVPRKAKSNSKRSVRHEDDGETDDDIPIVKKRVLPPTDDSQASSTKTTARIKAEKIGGIGNANARKKMEDGQTMAQNENFPQPNARKRLAPRGDGGDDDMRAPVAKKGKAANSTSTKPKNTMTVEPEPAPPTTKVIRSGETSEATGHGGRKGTTMPDQAIVEPVEDDDDQPPTEPTSKQKKRKKVEDNHDDQPRKAVKFSDAGYVCSHVIQRGIHTDECAVSPPHLSSQRLKENQSERKHKDVAKSSIKGDPDAPHLKLVTKPPSRAKRSKGPPREVLERIKASAARHLQCADSEPDELDCLP